MSKPQTQPKSTRRAFLQASLAGLGVAATAPRVHSSNVKKAPKILLRSSWQTVNIGDIGHTPGVLTLLEKYLPDAEVTLWPSKIDAGVEPLLMSRFPRLKLAMSEADKKEAIKTNDFLLHGSGPSLVAQKDVARWVKETDKPFGIYGITLSTVTDESRRLLNDASFVFFRDTVSLELAKRDGVACPIMEFGPDGAFAVDLADDAKANAYIKEVGLTPGKFLCCIPRLRYTPYWKIKEGTVFDEVKHARNEEMKEHDHAPLRAAITEVIRNTDLKILLCPEDRSQMAVGKELIWDQLSPEVQSRVVWRKDYWLTDEALSTYRQSAGLFGLEMHSPIMCLGNGIPAIVCRFEEQTSKGYMWQDIGLKQWLFHFDDEADVARMPKAVLEFAQQPKQSKEIALQAKARVEKRQRETMEILQRALAAVPS